MSQDMKMSLIEHLAELRTRLIYAALAIALGAIVAGVFWQPIVAYMTKSLREITAPEDVIAKLETNCFDEYLFKLYKARENKGEPPSRDQTDKGIQACGQLFTLSRSLQVIHPTESIFTLVKLSLMIGLLISAPFVLYQIWLFIIPALFPNERKYIRYGVMSGTGLFYAGVTFSFFVVFPTAMTVLKSIGEPYLTANYTLANYVSFMLWFVLGFGLAFELPLVLLVLAKLGIVTADFLRSKWKYAVVINLSAAAIITPTPDPFTMLTMAIPMIILYEVSIWLIRWFVKKPQAQTEVGIATEKGG